MNRVALLTCAPLIAVGLGCASDCSLDSDCGLGGECVELVFATGVSVKTCAPVLCAEDPSICPENSFCWPSPSGLEGDDLGSVCTGVQPCGSLSDSPICSSGEDTCSDGLVCGSTAGVDEQGQDVLLCGCIPPL